jgi:periplasmic protein TonB
MGSGRTAGERRELATQAATGFWNNDEGWAVAWPAALAFATLFHGFAFVVGQKAPEKIRSTPIEMAIALPPPPPLPPPEPPPEPPPPPEPEKPKPTPKIKDLPPPPNEAPPPDAPFEEVQAVTGVTAESVVESSPGGAQVRVGNTTFGNPDTEVFTPPQQVPRASAVPFDMSGYRHSVFEKMNREKRYPRKARLLGLEGRCIVKLLINRDGSLAAPPKLLGKGTGHQVLDEECLRMARVATFPPVVGETEVPVHLTQAISFTVIDP